MNSNVDWFFEKDTKWQEEYRRLRTIMLGCGLTEELKWGVPCYTFQKSNIVLIHGFKEYCALLFHKGALLSDTDNMLIQQTKNVQSARQLRFSNLNEIVRQAASIKAYTYEAMEVEKAGLKVQLKETAAFDMPEEFKQKLEENPTVKRAFEALTPGRQRAYLLHFSQARQAKTREARIEKCLPQILNGEGLNDYTKAKK
jgi:uncharacterized protein YdeI (YjbR/CyaY-like superfamily)